MANVKESMYHHFYELTYQIVYLAGARNCLRWHIQASFTVQPHYRNFVKYYLYFTLLVLVFIIKRVQIVFLMPTHATVSMQSCLTNIAAAADTT